MLETEQILKELSDGVRILRFIANAQEMFAAMDAENQSDNCGGDNTSKWIWSLDT